ncbi:hypothetical protein PLESTF_000640700, partial [Pleodorina starrii]
EAWKILGLSMTGNKGILDDRIMGLYGMDEAAVWRAAKGHRRVVKQSVTGSARFECSAAEAARAGAASFRAGRGTAAALIANFVAADSNAHLDGDVDSDDDGSSTTDGDGCGKFGVNGAGALQGNTTFCMEVMGDEAFRD